MGWFSSLLRQLFKEENFGSQGIPLQLCDVFLQELNKVDAENISYANLAQMLQPFLLTFATCRNNILLKRIEEKIFSPLMENNITPQGDGNSASDDTDDSSSEINYDPKKGKWVDGGKLPPKTQKEIQKMIDQRFHFANFNILLYCQEHIFKQASSKDGTKEENRDILYKLYDKGMNLEPEGEPELTFSQRMMLNKTQTFITKRMERRQRVHTQKRSKKLMNKLSKMLQQKLMVGGPAISSPDQIISHGSVILPPDSTQKQPIPLIIPGLSSQPILLQPVSKPSQVQKIPQKTPVITEKKEILKDAEDEVLNISVGQKRKQPSAPKTQAP